VYWANDGASELELDEEEFMLSLFAEEIPFDAHEDKRAKLARAIRLGFIQFFIVCSL